MDTSTGKVNMYGPGGKLSMIPSESTSMAHSMQPSMMNSMANSMVPSMQPSIAGSNAGSIANSRVVSNASISIRPSPSSVALAQRAPAWRRPSLAPSLTVTPRHSQQDLNRLLGISPTTSAANLAISQANSAQDLSSASPGRCASNSELTEVGDFVRSARKRHTMCALTQKEDDVDDESTGPPTTVVAAAAAAAVAVAAKHTERGTVEGAAPLCVPGQASPPYSAAPGGGAALASLSPAQSPQASPPGAAAAPGAVTPRLESVMNSEEELEAPGSDDKPPMATMRLSLTGVGGTVTDLPLGQGATPIGGAGPLPPSGPSGLSAKRRPDAPAPPPRLSLGPAPPPFAPPNPRQLPVSITSPVGSRRHSFADHQETGALMPSSGKSRQPWSASGGGHDHGPAGSRRSSRGQNSCHAGGFAGSWQGTPNRTPQGSRRPSEGMGDGDYYDVDAAGAPAGNRRVGEQPPRMLMPTYGGIAAGKRRPSGQSWQGSRRPSNALSRKDSQASMTSGFVAGGIPRTLSAQDWGGLREVTRKVDHLEAILDAFDQKVDQSFDREEMSVDQRFDRIEETTAWAILDFTPQLEILMARAVEEGPPPVGLPGGFPGCLSTSPPAGLSACPSACPSGRSLVALRW